MVDMSIEIPGGRAGHSVSPCRGTFISCVFVFFFIVLFWKWRDKCSERV